MTCKWCTKEATHGGRAPAGTVGLLFALACDTHAYLIETLGYEPMAVDEIARIERKKEKAKTQ
jgi:hypothetical protein